MLPLCLLTAFERNENLFTGSLVDHEVMTGRGIRQHSDAQFGNLEILRGSLPKQRAIALSFENI